MFNWFTKLPDAAQATIIGALIGAIIAALIALLTILIKDYWIPVLAEKRQASKARRLAFKKYANPLIVSSIALMYRLKEIFSNRGQFLLSSAPKNEFTRYKYISTLYRLCALLGWVRASELELSHVEVKNGSHFQTIQDAMINFSKSLADGQHIEQSIVKDVSQQLQIDISKLPTFEIEALGVEIEVLSDTYCSQEKVDLPKNLSTASKSDLIRKVADRLSHKVGAIPLTDQNLSLHTNACADEMSRVDAFIYRDWQSALGDVMLKATTNLDRKYDILGFKEFEELYSSTDPTTQKWVQRVERLFKDLDVKLIEKYDHRPLQLKAVYRATRNLLEVLSKNKTSNVNIAENAIRDLPKIL